MRSNVIGGDNDKAVSYKSKARAQQTAQVKLAITNKKEADHTKASGTDTLL
jgi:hypothetical protein